MNSRTIRYLIVLTIVACVGIIAIQVFGLRTAYLLQQEKFDTRVNTALRSAADNLWRKQGVQPPAYNPVEQLSKNYYIVQVNVPVNGEVLKYYIKTALSEQNINTDFAFCISDCNKPDTIGTIGYYQAPGSRYTKVKLPPFPKLKRENVYFGIYFPRRKEYLALQLNIWIISSLVLICIMGFLGYLLMIIFRQRQLSEIQKDFVSNMTHEFKTPLSSIALSAEVLRNPSIVSQPQRLLNYATIISNEANLLTAQVERVLQMVQAEKGGIPLERKEFVWQDLLREVVESAKLLPVNKNVTIDLRMTPTPILFKGDILHLKNVFGNLLDNAVRYCETNPYILIHLSQNNRHVVIDVQDNGIGIDTSHQKLLFEKFYRVPSGNVHNVKGFGLGLHYVKLIVRAHGGMISCQSSLGKGSIFTLTFPHYKA